MEPTAPPQTNPKHALYAILLLGFLGGIQTTDPIISSIALVDAAKALHFSSQTTALASSISTLALAATVIATGLFADRIGRKLLLMIALMVVIAGDLLVAASMNSPMYLTGRVIAGVGLGAVFGAAFAYVRAIAPDRIGSALGQFGAAGGIITMIGGLLGGTLVTTNWRMAYLVVPVLCCIGIILVPRMLPKVAKITASKIDYPGIILIGLGVIGILYGVSNASSSLSAPGTWAPILTGMLALLGFVFVEKHSQSPIFPIMLFKSPVFVVGAVSVLVWNFAQAVVVLQLSNFWQYIQHYTPTMVTFGQLPMSLLGVVASIIAGRSLAKGKSPGSRILLGFSLMTAGFLLFAILPQHVSYFMYIPALMCIGFGLPYVVVPAGQLFMSESPAKFLGPVTSSKTTIGQFGYSLGLAGSMVLVSSLTDGGITKKLIASGVPPSQTGQGLDAVTTYVNTGVHIHTQVAQDALRAAAGSYSIAFSSAMFIAAGITVSAGVFSYFLLLKASKKQSLHP